MVASVNPSAFVADDVRLYRYSCPLSPANVVPDASVMVSGVSAQDPDVPLHGATVGTLST